MTYIYQGNEYTVVRNWSPDELLAYRELVNGHIEVLSMFCGMHDKAMVHPALMKMVLEAREYQAEVITIHEQIKLNAEIDKAAGEERVSA